MTLSTKTGDQPPSSGEAKESYTQRKGRGGGGLLRTVRTCDFKKGEGGYVRRGGILQLIRGTGGKRYHYTVIQNLLGEAATRRTQGNGIEIKYNKKHKGTCTF